MRMGTRCVRGGWGSGARVCGWGGMRACEERLSVVACVRACMGALVEMHA